jgi:hypothetical protein
MIDQINFYDLRIREIKYEINKNLYYIKRNFFFERNKGLSEIFKLLESFSETDIKIFNILQKKIDLEYNSKIIIIISY